MHYKVYSNPRVHDPDQPARFLAIKLSDIKNRPQEEQLRIRDFVNLLTEKHLPETRLKAAGHTSWETVTNFVEWIDEVGTYLPLYHWTTGERVEIENGLVWNTRNNHYYLLHVFQDEGIPAGVHYDPATNTLVPIPQPDPDPRDHQLNINNDLDPEPVPNGNQNQNPHCNPNPRPRRMGDDFKLTAISKLPKFDGEMGTSVQSLSRSKLKVLGSSSTVLPYHRADSQMIFVKPEGEQWFSSYLVIH